MAVPSAQQMQVRQAPGANARLEGAYRDAIRHSARVRLLKRLIPFGATLTVLVVIVGAFFNPFSSSQGNVSVAAIDLSGSKITMEKPKLQGFKKDARPYEVNAKTAAQDIKKPNIVELNELDARMAMGTDGWAHLQSPFGIYDSQKDLLNLYKSVRVLTDGGYDVRLKSADIEFKTGHVVSNEPVQVLMKEGTIDAEKLEIVDNGKKLTFTGRVRTLFYGEDGQGNLRAEKPAAATSNANVGE